MKKLNLLSLSILAALTGCCCPNEKPAEKASEAAPAAAAPAPKTDLITYDLTAANTDTIVFKEGEAVSLPAPHQKGGAPLMDLLMKRKSGRAYADRPLTIEMLSDLLWATTGKNREDGRWTIATAINSKNMITYVMLKNGTFIYQPDTHTLLPVKEGNMMKDTGKQPFVGTGAVELCFIADDNAYSRPVEPGIHRDLMDGMHAGAASQNIYLFAAQNQLETVLRAAVDREAMAQALSLKEGQIVMGCQSVGFPGEANP